MTGDKLQELIKELRSLSEKFKDFWRDNVGFLESAINFLLKNYELPPIDLPNAKQEEKRLSESYKHQLDILHRLIRQIGFKSIYILVDKLDETEKTGNDPEKTYQLLKPIVKDLELLGLSGYGFKFFLWDKIEPFFREDARPDRISQYNLKWSRSLLEKVLSKRLIAFSNDNIRKFEDILSEPVGYPIDTVLCVLANKSPRNLIRLCEKIFSVQAEIDPDSSKKSSDAIDKGSILYCEQISTELYGPEIVKELQRVGRELFTINYLSSSVFKTAHENTSRNRVTKWQKLGVIKQVGVVSSPEARRPLNLYYVSDPTLIRIIHRSSLLKDFIMDRWLPCAKCESDNLMDIQLLPEGNDLICHYCNRVL